MRRSFRLSAGLFLVIINLHAALADTSLVTHSDSWLYRKGTNAPQSDWKTALDASLDATWLTGNGGIGYSTDNMPAETVNCQTILTDMVNRYSTVYMRRSFNVASAVDATAHLQLTMDFDDGFIAWLDGVYLTNRFVTGAPTEPAFNALANGAGHESSHGNNSPQPVETYDFGLVGARLPVGTHVLAIIGLNQAIGSTDFIQVPDFALVTNVANCISGAIAVNTTWYASNSPVIVCGSVTVNSGVTLTIQPGTTVQLGAGVNIAVANGGILMAQGTSNAPILFTRSGASGNWGNITINGALGSPESRITYARFEFNISDAATPAIEVNTGSAFLDHLDFATTGSPFIHVDGASFVISHCYFPKPTAGFEPCHGTRGVRPDGHGVFRRCFFGHPTGYNDVVDFTGSQRGTPIVHFINNVVSGGDDDGWDLDGTDAWVEGNIFMHMHRNNGTPDSSSGVSGGGDSGNTSEITVIRNIFFDCDEASDAKEGNFFTFFNNTMVHQNHAGGNDTSGALVILSDTNFTTHALTAEGKGMYLEGNVVYDIEALTRDVFTAIVTFTNDILPVAYAGPGGGNTIAAPIFKHVPQVSETLFTNWADAQIMWDWLSLQPGSPGIGAGPNGTDQGAVIPLGASISGEPIGTTTNATATLLIGINRTGSGIPTAGFPNGSGYIAYKWRLDGGPWSAETPINTPIILTGLASGAHYVEVTGKRDSLLYQDDPLFGEDAVLSRSRTWNVQTSLQITSPALSGNDFTLHFSAAAGNTYSVQYRDAFDPAHPWSILTNVPAQPSTGDYAVTNSPAPGPSRFYRVVTPAQ